MVDFAVCRGDKSWLDEARDAGFVLDLSKALFQKVMDQKSVRDFRWAPMKAEDYLASEHT
jgi:hypothetical protein